MNADNGVYIVKFPDGYRVIHARAIEMIDYYPEGTKERKETLKYYFEKSPLFVSKDEAILYAHELAEGVMLEYGVNYLGEYESYKETIT